MIDGVGGLAHDGARGQAHGPQPGILPQDVAVHIGQQSSRLLQHVASPALLARRRDAIAATFELLSATGGRCAVVGSLASGLEVAASDVDVVIGLADVDVFVPGNDFAAERMAGRHSPSIKLPLLSPVLTAVVGNGIHQFKTKSKEFNQMVKAAFLKHGFECVQYVSKGAMLRMLHTRSGLFVDVSCDPAASHTRVSLAEMQAAAARGLAERHELVRVLHRVLRCAIGAELRVCETYSVAGQSGCGSYPLLLLVRRWFLESQRSGGAHYRHDSGAETAVALLALLDHLSALLDEVPVEGSEEWSAGKGLMIELAEPPPVDGMPGVPPIRFNLWSVTGRMSGQHSSSVVALVLLARELARALRRGVPLLELVRTASPQRSQLLEAVLSAMAGKVSKARMIREALAHSNGTSTQRCQLSLSGLASVLAAVEEDVYMTPPSTPNVERPEAATGAPPRSEAPRIETGHGLAFDTSSKLNSNAPVFVPRAYHGQPNRLDERLLW